MFGIGLGELLVIAVALLLCTKPGELPDLARKAGRFLGKLREARDEAAGSVKDAMETGDGSKESKEDADDRQH